MLLEGADCSIQTRGLDVPIINCLLGHAVNRSELLAQPSQPAVTHPDDAAHNLSGVFGQGLFLFLEDFMHVGFACLQGRAFFFNDTATTEIYTLSLHDALPI